MNENKPYENLKCPDCSGKMTSRKGPYGVFWGCNNYPECKGTRDNQSRSKQDRAEIEDSKRTFKNDREDKETLDSLMKGARRFSFRKL